MFKAGTRHTQQRVGGKKHISILKRIFDLIEKLIVGNIERK